MTCEHKNFHCHAAVARISDVEGGPITQYCATIEIHCVDCKKPFEFVGLPCGLTPYRPTVGIDGLELRAPIVPQGQKVAEGLPSFGVSVGGTA